MRAQELELQPENKYTIVLIPSILSPNIKKVPFNLDKLKQKQTTPHLYPMVTQIWNCRGMNKPNFMAAYKDLINHHKTYIIILTETKINKDKVLALLPSLGFSN